MPVDGIYLDKMSVDEMYMYKMSVDEMFIYKMTVDEKCNDTSVGEMTFYNQTENAMAFFPTGSLPIEVREQPRAPGGRGRRQEEEEPTEKPERGRT